MLGTEQRDWIFEDLAGTKARWNVLAQQTASLPERRRHVPAAVQRRRHADNWDGYVAERQRIIDWAIEHQTPNVVVLTGDTHRNWVRNIPGTTRVSTTRWAGSPRHLDLNGGDTKPRELLRPARQPAPALPEQQPRLREVHAHAGRGRPSTASWTRSSSRRHRPTRWRPLWSRNGAPGGAVAYSLAIDRESRGPGRKSTTHKGISDGQPQPPSRPTATASSRSSSADVLRTPVTAEFRRVARRGGRRRR